MLIKREKKNTNYSRQLYYINVEVNVVECYVKVRLGWYLNKSKKVLDQVRLLLRKKRATQIGKYLEISLNLDLVSRQTRMALVVCQRSTI